MSEYGLQDDDKQIILDILKTYPQIEEVILFGSRALNTFKATSDIDLAIKGKDTNSIVAALMADFEESDLIYQVDLVDYASISTEKLLEHIDQHGTVFYRKGWVEVRLGEVLELIIDHRGKTPKKLGGDWSLNGYRAISAKSIKNGVLVNEDKMNILPEKLYHKWMKTEVEYGDIFLTSEAPLGEHLIWRSNEKVVLSQRIFGIRTNKDYLDPFYFNYFIDGGYYQHELKSRESGSTVTGIKQSELIQTKVIIPPLAEQKSIANILSSFDEKIDLLREQNKTLETLAQTIFKEWFVNFNYPGATGEMVDSELGELPTGWWVGKLGSLIKTNRSSIKKNFEIDLIEYLDTGSITEGHIESTQKLHLADAPSRARRIVQHNDLLISTVRPNLKHYGILKEPTDNLIVSTGFCVITCDKVDPHFVYYLLTTNEMTDYLHSVAEGSTSTYPSIKPSDIEKIEYAFPSENILKLFSGYAGKAWNKIIFNQEQIQSLSKTRDTLLPNLLSGEIRLGEAYEQ